MELNDPICHSSYNKIVHELLILECKITDMSNQNA